ncbi:MAG: hypothetical protein R2845_01895 [Thermomicrobiales bacterium]
MQIKVGEKIAELTQNEAAYVSSGAAGGISLALAACIAGTIPPRSTPSRISKESRRTKSSSSEPSAMATITPLA